MRPLTGDRAIILSTMELNACNTCEDSGLRGAQLGQPLLLLLLHLMSVTPQGLGAKYRRTSLFLMAPRLNRITLRMMTTENMNIGNTNATAILQRQTLPLSQLYLAMAQFGIEKCSRYCKTRSSTC